MPLYPNVRLRRLRDKLFIRELVEEHHLRANDLVYPVFVLDDSRAEEPIPSMPGQIRAGEQALFRIAEDCLELKIPAIALFPAIDPALRTLCASEAYHADGLVPRRIAAIKKRFPELGVITDIALDPYTSHGQDGIIDNNGQVTNDETIRVLQQQALCHAQAGADMVAPSDMMDGRIGQIRKVLDTNGFEKTLILAYAAKYASAFYGPFREAVGSSTTLKGDKKSYQINPANGNEAMREIALDIAEGADIVMIKPGGSYLDVISKTVQQFGVPTFAYQVSGEYSMIVAAANQGWLNRKHCVLESLLAFKRAGCQGIFSYFARDVARWLR